MKKAKLGLAVAAALFAQNALAQSTEQQVRVSVEKVEGNNYQAKIYYRSSDGSGATGLGLRFHYPSSLVTMAAPTLDFSEENVGVSEEPDSDVGSDFDSNPLTDNFYTAAWFVLSGANWPLQRDLETLLLTFDFALKDGANPAQIPFNFTASSVSTGYTFAPTNFLQRLPDINVAPAGADKVVNLNEEQTHTLSQADFGFTDEDSNTFIAVKISSLPNAGSLKLNGTDVEVGQLVEIANLSSLVFTPAANASGNAYSTFTFQVKDNGADPTTGKSGSIDLDPVPNSFTFNVAAVNDAPSGSNNTVQLNEDGDYTFAAADFGFSDTDDTPENNFASLTLTSLPSVGALTLNGAGVTIGQQVPVAQISTLVYTPSANLNGANAASFTFQVGDDGGTDSGGIAIDGAPKTMTLSVSSVNDAPVGTDKGISILEGNTRSFAIADFGLTDPNDATPNALLNVIIQSLPAQGSLKLNNVDVAINDIIPAASLANLVYTPPVGVTGAAIANFSFKVQDNGGTSNNGSDTAVASNTISLSVTDINSAPSGASNTISLNENAFHDFAANEFGFTDSADTPPNALSAVRISSLPSSGALTLSGGAVSVGQEVGVGQISNLRFTPAAHGNGATYANFTFQVKDDGGTQEGGVDLDPTPRTITLNVASINSAPTGANNSVSVLEDEEHTFSSADFGFSDSNDTPANTLSTVIIDSLPGAGTLKLNGNAVTAGQSVPAASLGQLVYAPAANKFGDAYASFTFRVQDNGGVANGGLDTDASARTITVNVSAVNDWPAGSDKLLTVNENASLNLQVDDFGFKDVVDGANAGQLKAVQIVSLPAVGSLTLDGNAVAEDQLIQVADLPDLAFTPVAHENGEDYAQLVFRVQDDGGTAQGGVDLQVTTSTLSFDVRAANSAPVGVSNETTILEGASYTFSAAAFGFSDTLDNPQNTLLAVKIASLPAKGELLLDDTAVVAEQSIPTASLAQLVYKPAAHGNGDDYANFTFQVQDNGGTEFGGKDLDQVAKTFNFDVTAINSAPAGSNLSVNIAPNGSYTFSQSSFGFSDVNDAPAPNNFLSVTLDTVPGNEQGELLLNDAPVTAGSIIPLADLVNLVYTPPEGETANNFASITFRVKDNGGVENEGKDTDITARTISFNVGFIPPDETPPSSTPPAVTDQVNDLNGDIDAIEAIEIVEGQAPSDEVVNQVGNALDKTNALAQQVTETLPEGEAGVGVALTALDSMSRTLTASAKVSSGGGAVSNTAATNSINSVATVLNALSTRTESITPQQRATVQALASTTVSNSSNLIRAGATNDELVSMVAATSAVINAASAAGGELTTELVAQAEALVTKAVKTGMSSFAPGVDVEDPVQLGNLLRTNPDALQFAIDASVAVKSRIKPDAAAVDQELASRGIEGAASANLTSVLNAVSNPDGITVGGSSASEVLLSALVQFLTGGAQALTTDGGLQTLALSTGGIDLAIDSLTGTVIITAPGEKYSAAIANTKIVSASVPEGLSFMRDGRALIVANGVAMELAPIALDLIGFTNAVEKAGFNMTLRDGGLVDINISANERFVGVFAFDNISNATGSCGATTIVEPTGALNAPSYAFGLNCANGVQQRIVPFVHDAVFYRSVAGYGLTMSTDRNTGIVTIPTIGKYKPSFFVSKLTASEETYLTANKDARGSAFKEMDLNGDGLADIVFYTAAGAQVLYKVAQ